MAYAIENTRRRQTQAFLAVGLIHGLAIWAIASGFASSMVHVIRDRLVAQQWKEEVKITPIAPPPDVKHPPRSEPRRIVAPRADIVLGPTDPMIVTRGIDLTPITPIGPTEVGPILPSETRPTPSPSFAIRAAAPKGSPGSWVSDRDYPTAAIREERAGLTRFHLTIGGDGRVTGCEVTVSSGSADLDAATCSKVSARARFTPALGGDGMPTTGSYNGSIRWVLPRF